jgi:hypothetical protein
MDNRFTPGPWAVYNDNEGDDPVYAPLWCVANAAYHDGEDDSFQTTLHHGIAADADLIAAAPDLYVALDVIVNHYTRLASSGNCGNWDPATEPQVIAAEAALAKARGEYNG